MRVTHHDLALAARAAYEPENSIRLEHDLEFTPYANIIAIRGSEFDPRDWLRNFMVIPARCGGIGPAPMGAARAALRLDHYLSIRNVGIGLDLDFPIYVTGHSAGGADGILLAELLARRGWPIAECVVFGAHRTGKRDLSVPTTIYDHAGDPVCDLPWFWRHPVEPVVLPDVSGWILQHDMDYYVAALEVLSD